MLSPRGRAYLAGALVVLALDPLASNLPRRVAFPILVANAVAGRERSRAVTMVGLLFDWTPGRSWNGAPVGNGGI